MRRPMIAGLIAAPVLTLAVQAHAQDVADPHAGVDHAGVDHAGMDHDGADMSGPEADGTAMSSPHAGHVMAEDRGVDDTPGNAPAPPVPTDMAAEAFYPRDVMRRSLADTLAGMRFRGSALVVDQMEYRARDGKDGYGFEGLGWFGGDIDRAVLAFRGEGAFGETPETLELSGMWRHAIDPWFNLQAGVRQDLGAGPDRTYGLIGIEGLAPSWIEVSGQFLFSDKGDARIRTRLMNDQRITNRLILEPEAEVDFAFRDMPQLGVGSGFEKVGLAARLRYEFSGMFAPYVGVLWERKLGETARLARAEGEKAGSASALAGVRFAF